MQRVNMRSITCTVLVIILAAALAACAPAAASTTTKTAAGTTASSAATTTAKANVPDYLNFSSELPLVKTGQNIKLSVIVYGDATFGDPKKIWFWEYVRRAMNIDMSVEVTQDNKTWVSLAFASKNLPDILLCNLTTADIVRYGQDEKQILAYNQYLNETLMPKLNKQLKANPNWQAEITAPDGKIYSAPKIADMKTITGLGGTVSYLINQPWLAKAGLKAPTNLDELLVVLRAFKTMNAKAIPLGGGYEASSTGYIILNALGYTGTDAKGFQVCTRNGKVVFPFADREVFGQYLKYMNTLYKEKLISQDYFTLDGTAVKAQIAEGLVGVIPDGITSSNITNYKDYWGTPPLTSAWNSKPQWKMNSDGVSIGSCSVSASCKYPEVACRFIDWFYEETSQNSLLAWIGPSNKDTDIQYGMVPGYVFDPATGARSYIDVTNKKYPEAGACVKGTVAGFMERFGYTAKKDYAGYALNKLADKYVELVYNDTNVTQIWHWDRYSIQQNLKPYLVFDYPSIVFFSQAENTEVSDLKVVLEGYATQEIAKFIIGDRALTDSELNKYFDTLDSMGLKDYLKYYADYYKQVKG